MNNIPSDIFLNEYYDCNSTIEGYTTSRQKINCTHWSTNESGCDTICSLNVLSNPKWTDCLKCEKREKIKEIDVEKLVPKKVNTLIPKPKPPSLIKKAVSYAKAETSQMFNGKVSEEIYNKRKDICISCDYKVNPLPETEPIGWCKGGCGCKIGNPRAGLSQKLYMPTVTCPLKKFGPETGAGFKVADAIDSVKGIATAINETLKPDTEENK